MQSAGLPYLGAVQFIRDESIDELNESVFGIKVSLKDGDGNTASIESGFGGLRPTQGQDQAIGTDLTIQSPRSEFIAIRFLRSAGEGSLVLWIGLFAARLILDASWRELASVAPLAAVSRMIVGIQ